MPTQMKHPKDLARHLRDVHGLTIDTIAVFATLEQAHKADHQPHIGQTHEHQLERE